MIAERRKVFSSFLSFMSCMSLVAGRGSAGQAWGGPLQGPEHWNPGCWGRALGSFDPNPAVWGWRAVPTSPAGAVGCRFSCVRCQFAEEWRCITASLTGKDTQFLQQTHTAELSDVGRSPGFHKMQKCCTSAVLWILLVCSSSKGKDVDGSSIVVWQKALQMV